MKRSILTLACLPFGWLSLAQAQPDNATPWPAHNRHLALHLGQQQQNYRELDTQDLATNGTLNTEAGHQRHLGAAISYQTTSGWLLGLGAQRQTGATAYSGYLQAGSGSLSPYAAHSLPRYF
jgi:hypothetical protein